MFKYLALNSLLLISHLHGMSGSIEAGSWTIDDDPTTEPLGGSITKYSKDIQDIIISNLNGSVMVTYEAYPDLPDNIVLEHMGSSFDAATQSVLYPGHLDLALDANQVKLYTAGKVLNNLKVSTIKDNSIGLIGLLAKRIYAFSHTGQIVTAFINNGEVSLRTDGDIFVHGINEYIGHVSAETETGSIQMNQITDKETRSYSRNPLMEDESDGLYAFTTYGKITLQDDNERTHRKVT